MRAVFRGRIQGRTLNLKCKPTMSRAIGLVRLQSVEACLHQTETGNEHAYIQLEGKSRIEVTTECKFVAISTDVSGVSGRSRDELEDEEARNGRQGLYKHAPA